MDLYIYILIMACLPSAKSPSMRRITLWRATEDIMYIFWIKTNLGRYLDL